MLIRKYSELSQLSTFEDRYAYLRLQGSVGVETFGVDRYLNQRFYKSREWGQVRHHVIVRDLGCDLGIQDLEIPGKILIHHMNPITVMDIRHNNLDILDPEFLICCSHDTHNAIHYGDLKHVKSRLVERTPGDTTLWGKQKEGSIYV